MPNKTEQQVAKVGVMLVNTGTPSAPTKQAIKTYLANFLSDRHIVNLPPLLWKPILHGIVLNTRPHKTAKIYQSIWTEQGSPYTLCSEQIERQLQAAVNGGADGTDNTDTANATNATSGTNAASTSDCPALVKMAHRYGQPSIPHILEQFAQQNIGKLIVLPLYPQQAFSTTTSVLCELERAQNQLNYHPEQTIIENYHDHPLYIAALAAQIKPQTSPEAHIVFSYHSVPLKDLRNGDKYLEQVKATTALLTKQLDLPSDCYSTVFQSRFEDAQRWQGPFLSDKLQELFNQGTRNFVVVAPIFAVDCTETLYEIDQKARSELLNFAQKQGTAPDQLQFTYIPALNNSNAQIELLEDIVNVTPPRCGGINNPLKQSL
jgi:ferrochelatase